MSIQSQIDRINNAKSSLKSAISSKGVSVPVGASIDDLPALVESIQAGGGGDESLALLKMLIVDDTEDSYDIVLPDDFTKIKHRAFSWRPDINSVSGPEVVEIPDKIKYVYIPTIDETVEENHGSYAFSNSGIASADFPKLEYIGEYAFEYSLLSEINMPSVKHIGANAFYYCLLNNLVLPEGLEYIGICAFSDCTLPDKFRIPSNVTVGDRAFWSASMSEVVIGAGAILENSPFFYCNNLKTVTFEGKPLHVLALAEMENTTIETINCPWAEGEVRGAPWGADNATVNYNYTGE